VGDGGLRDRHGTRPPPRRIASEPDTGCGRPPDLDLENLGRLAGALIEFGARPRDLPEGAPTAKHLANAPVVAPLTTHHGELHIVRHVPGAPPDDELRSSALLIDFDGIVLAVAALDHLIAMKRDGQAGNLRDVAALTALLHP
jgi:hypothetical protein